MILLTAYECRRVLNSLLLAGTEEAADDLAEPCGDSRGESAARQLPSGHSVS